MKSAPKENHRMKASQTSKDKNDRHHSDDEKQRDTHHGQKKGRQHKILPCTLQHISVGFSLSVCVHLHLSLSLCVCVRTCMSTTTGLD